MLHSMVQKLRPAHQMKSKLLTHQKLYKIILYLTGLAGTCAGVSLCLKSTMGVDAWNAAMAGLSNITPISLGQWSILIQFSFWAISALLDKKICLKTIFPVVYKGLVLDVVNPWISGWHFPNDPFFLFVVFLMGYFVISLSTGVYLSTGYARMPVDGLMFSLSTFLHKEIRWSRLIIECIGFFHRICSAWGVWYRNCNHDSDLRLSVFQMQTNFRKNTAKQFHIIERIIDDECCKTVPFKNRRTK